MKGTFKITLDYLKELGACDKGLLAFKEAYPQGGEYQEILDRCCAEDHIDWAVWLLSEVGATDDVCTYDDFVFDKDLDIVFAGRVEFTSGVLARRLIVGKGIKAGWGIEAVKYINAGKGIEAGLDIRAGLSIEAGWEIRAGWDIDAGWGIKADAGIIAGGGIKAGEGITADFGIIAGEGINAGESFGIFAGLNVKVFLWEHYAKVIAKSKPENLISGYWEQLPEGENK